MWFLNPVFKETLKCINQPNNVTPSDSIYNDRYSNYLMNLKKVNFLLQIEPQRVFIYLEEIGFVAQCIQHGLIYNHANSHEDLLMEELNLIGSDNSSKNHLMIVTMQHRHDTDIHIVTFNHFITSYRCQYRVFVSVKDHVI